MGSAANIERVLNELRGSDWAMTVREIVGATGLTKDAARKAVERLVARGVLGAEDRVPLRKEDARGGRAPKEYRIVSPFGRGGGGGADGVRVEAAAEAYLGSVYDYASCDHEAGEVMPDHGAVLDARTLAGARRGWLVRKREHLRQRAEELRLAHERSPVPGYPLKVHEQGEQMREMDVRIDELTRLLRRTVPELQTLGGDNA